MEEQIHALNTYSDFLNTPSFIEWRLFGTDELNRYWADFIMEYPDKKVQLDQAVQVFKSIRINDKTVPESVKNNMYHDIIQHARKRKKTRKIALYTSVAACIICLLIPSFFFLFQRRDTPQPLAENNDIENRSMNKEIQLITADKVIELAGKDVQIELGEDGQALLLGVETETSELKLDTHTTNKLIVPYGKRSKVKLADGSRIWLNSGTELEFPSTFDGKTRQITIRGEMYLEVNRDETKSFIVHVPGFDILVHGTKFNVSAYADNHIQTVVLTEGKIEVTSPDRSPVMLSPNEMLLLQPDKWRKDTVNAQQHISWIDGMLYLNKISVTDVLKKIRRYYNVEFVMDEHELQAKTCTGKLYLSDDIDDVMISLSAISATEYHHERGKIHVKLKNTTLMTKDNLKKKHTNRII